MIQVMIQECPLERGNSALQADSIAAALAVVIAAQASQTDFMAMALITKTDTRDPVKLGVTIRMRGVVPANIIKLLARTSFVMKKTTFRLQLGQ